MKNSMLFALTLLFSTQMFAQNIQIRDDIYRFAVPGTNHYLRGQETSVSLEPMDPSWESAKWRLERVEGTDFFRIQNQRNTNTYIHIKHSLAELGAIDMGWWSAQWSFIKIPGYNNAFYIQNRLLPTMYLYAYGNTLEAGTFEQDLSRAEWVLSFADPATQAAAKAESQAAVAAAPKPAPSHAIIDERVPDYYVLMKVCNRYWAGTDCTVYVSVQDATGYSSGWIALDEAGNDFTVDSQYAYQVNFGRKLQSPVKLWVKLGNEYSDSMCLEGVGLSTNPNSPNFIQMSENNDFWLEPGTSTVELGF